MPDPNGPSAEDMGLSAEDMKTPEQRERERSRLVVHEIAVSGYGSMVSDPDRLEKAASYVTDGALEAAESSGVEVPTDYLEGVKDLIAAIREREGMSLTLSRTLIEEVVARAESGDAAGLYSSMADMGRPAKERGKGAQLDPENDAAIIEAAQKVLGSRDASETITADVLKFYELMRTRVEEYIRIIAEKEKLITEYEQFLNGAEAEEYLENAGMLPAEALLEARGDDRTWPELPEEEKGELRRLLGAYAEREGRKLEEDDDSCMVM